MKIGKINFPEIVMGFLLAVALVAVYLVFVPIDSPHHGPESESDQTAKQEREGDSEERRIADYTWWLMLFTGILAVSTGGLWWSTRRLWKAGERQIKLAEDGLSISQRPWIKIDAGIVILQNDARGFYLECLLTLKNIGQSPAMRVRLKAAPLFQRGLGPGYEIVRAMIYNEIVADKTQTGLVIYPGFDFDTQIGARVPIEYLNWRHAQRNEWNSGGIVISVAYDFAVNAKTYVTSCCLQTNQYDTRGEFSNLYTMIGRRVDRDYAE